MKVVLPLKHSNFSGLGVLESLLYLVVFTVCDFVFSEMCLPASGSLLCLSTNMGLLGTEIAFSGTDSSVSSLFLLRGPYPLFLYNDQLCILQKCLN